MMKTSARRVVARYAAGQGVRAAFFPDWIPEREENPNGLRDILAHPVPLLHDESRKYDHLRAALPGTGDDPHKTAYDYHENPYSVMMPREIRALLNDPTVQGEERKRVTEAFLNLKSWEDGKWA